MRSSTHSTPFRPLAGVALTALVGATLLAGCTAPADGGTPDEAPASVQVYLGTDPVFAPVYYAAQEGLFAEHNVEVGINLFPSGTEAIESYRSSGGGMIVAGDLPSMRAWLVGDTVGVLPTSWDTKTFSVIVNAGIEEPADLAGGTIATVVGSSGSFYAHNYLADNDLTDSVEVINLSPADMPAALARGDIDGFIWNASTINAALAAVPGSYLLNEGSEGYLVNRIIVSAGADTIAETPEAVERAVAAITEACDAIMDDQEAAAEVIAGYLSIETERVLSDWTGVEFDCTFDQAFVDDMTAEGTVGAEIGLTDGELDWSSMFDVSFLETADAGKVTGSVE
jgi:NitT/TauT family transport system substrate-binding protein